MGRVKRLGSVLLIMLGQTANFNRKVGKLWMMSAIAGYFSQDAKRIARSFGSPKVREVYIP